MNTIRTTARRRRSFVNVGVAGVAIVASVTMTAACGTDTTSPANAPVDARIYPPTDVPEVGPGSTSADAAERRMTQNEEKMRRAGGRPGMP